MQSHYIQDTTKSGFPQLAVLDVVELEKDFFPWVAKPAHLITRLNVPKGIRRRGHARALLNLVCDMADQESCRLIIQFSPYTGTDPVMLLKLYLAFGFREESTGLLVRKPIEPALSHTTFGENQTQPDKPKIELAGVGEIADMAQVSRQAASQWRTRYEDFPKPLADLAMGPIYNRADIEAWLKKRDQRSSE